jgi:hypothetical protein
MAITPPVNAPPRSNFQSTFSNALREYKKQTEEDLFLHPLAAKLQSCDSPDAILSVLQEQASDERLSNSLGPVVNVIYALSSSLGEDAGLVRQQRFFIRQCGLLTCFKGFTACESHLCWDWHLALSEDLP